MTNGLVENELLELSSSYSQLTAERILERFGIQLDHKTLHLAMNNPLSVYSAILWVPFKNVVNGIVQQQAYDYQVYAQKLFIDYLVSGHGNEDPEGQGAQTRVNLDLNRQALVALTTLFEKDVLTHKVNILETQAHLLKTLASMGSIVDTESVAHEIQSAIRSFRDRAVDMGLLMSERRFAFKSLILDTLRLIQLLPDYTEDADQDKKNRSTLQFDDHLGE